MIRACHERFPGRRASFRVGGTPPEPVDYALFSGTFNLCMIDDAGRWRGYILDRLEHCRPVCRSGMVVNLLCRRRMAISNNISTAVMARTVVVITMRSVVAIIHNDIADVIVISINAARVCFDNSEVLYDDCC